MSATEKTVVVNKTVVIWILEGEAEHHIFLVQDDWSRFHGILLNSEQSDPADDLFDLVYDDEGDFKLDTEIDREGAELEIEQGAKLIIVTEIL